MALFRLVVVAALFLLLGAWASQATAHNNHVNKPSYYVKISRRGVYNDDPKPAPKSPKSPGNYNNGGTPTTQVTDPTYNFNPNVIPVDTTNKVVETTTVTMAEPPQLSGTCDGNHRALGGWLAIIIVVALYYHHHL